MKKLLAVSAAAFVSTLPLAVHDAVAAEPGFYVGAGGQYATASHDHWFDDNSNFDDSDFNYNVFAGYRANNFVGVEIGYVDLGKFQDNSSDGTEGSEIKADGFQVTLMGFLPINDRSELYARGGVYAAHVKESDCFDSGEGCVASFSQSFDDTGMVLGGGGQMDFGPVTVRAELSWYDSAEVDTVWAFGIGAQWNFGGPTL